eukprot:m.84007 g.84007  ORF g.84007 m.84007 type:complete len:191 (+) comp36380_c0_seq2:254-826(+)
MKRRFREIFYVVHPFNEFCTQASLVSEGGSRLDGVANESTEHNEVKDEVEVSSDQRKSNDSVEAAGGHVAPHLTTEFQITEVPGLEALSLKFLIEKMVVSGTPEEFQRIKGLVDAKVAQGAQGQVEGSRWRAYVKEGGDNAEEESLQAAAAAKAATLPIEATNKGGQLPEFQIEDSTLGNSTIARSHCRL